MRDLLQLKQSTHAALCLECGKCSTMCPLSRFGGFSAARMMSIHEPDADIHSHAPAVQRCLTCGACEQRCPQGVRYTEFVRGLRFELPWETRRSCPHGAVFEEAARWAADGAINGRNRSWLEDDLAVAEEGEVALFVGCLPLFDVVFGSELNVRMVEIARSAVRLLNRLGIEPVVVGEERCCGHDLLWSGHEDTFEKLAVANSAAFREHGVRHLLTTCAECCSTWRLDYPRYVDGYSPRVQHISEFLAERMQGSDELSFRALDDGSTMTFQDPCRLGRQLGVFEAPRKVMAALPGSELVEMERSAADAQCCGTPGFIHCNRDSRRLQSRRLASAAATGASRLVTACPKCLIHFRCAQDENRRSGDQVSEIRVEDLTVLAASLLTIDERVEKDAPPERQR
jgi:heterodisulfide reductase subunit D